VPLGERFKRYRIADMTLKSRQGPSGGIRNGGPSGAVIVPSWLGGIMLSTCFKVGGERLRRFSETQSALGKQWGGDGKQCFRAPAHAWDRDIYAVSVRHLAQGLHKYVCK
jgi:hypothetical protein